MLKNLFTLWYSKACELFFYWIKEINMAKSFVGLRNKVESAVSF